MRTMTGSGAGGAGIDVITGFGDWEDDDHNSDLQEMRRKVNALGKPLGESATRAIVPSPMDTWLGTSALAPHLGLIHPSDVANLLTPRLFVVDEPLGTYN